MSELFTEAYIQTLEVANIIVSDTFAALGSGTSIDGWTPDTINTPSNNWVNADGRIQGDGSGNIQNSAAGGDAYYNTGISDDKIRIEVNYTTPGSFNNFFLPSILSDGAGTDRLSLQVFNDGTLVLQERVGGSNTTLATSATVLSTSTAYKLSIEYDGSDVIVKVDDSVISDLTQTSYSVPAGMTGNTYIQIRYANGPQGTVQDLKVYDL